ncbi:MAG: transglutaminase family protein [Methanosarcina sp.]|jgi:transglutaminase-like putative cysteine protease
MNSSEVLEKNAPSIIAVLLICLVLVTITGFLFSDSLGNFTHELRNYLGLGAETESSEEVFIPDMASFTFPAIPSYSTSKSELTPILRTPLQPGFSLSSNYQTSEFFQGGVSYFKISIENEGRNPIFIDRYGVSVNASENRIFSEDCGALLSPGEEQSLGVIAVQVPEEEKARFSIVLWLLASTSEGKWHEYEPYFLNGFTSDLKPMPEKITPKYRYNPDYYFKTINRLVEPSEPDVRGRAAQVARSYPGAYNIYQVCALFDMVKEEIEYVSDPRGNDVWEPANVTLRIGAGDCEDQAILLSSMLEAVGGTTRVYLTDDHAFAAAYIGKGNDSTDAAVKGVRAYYGNVDINYLTDEYGSWLMLDPTSSLYAGGLPGKTAQAKVQAVGENETYRSWTFVNTSTVKVIDISTRAIK